MYDHIGFKVRDLAKSVEFYKAALEPLGHVLGSNDATYAGIGPEGEPSLWLYASKDAKSPGVHIAFRAENRAAVDRFFKKGIENGGKDNGQPGVRADYSPSYYAAFLIDPDGNNVEAVCTK
jgi:catechol 2,3-dioxygenase-like lactoylglutathione lyase family enzyme